MADRHVANITTSQFEKIMKLFHGSVADLYNASASYVANDIVVYNGLLYQCKENCTGAWDATKWQVQKVFDNEGYFIFQSV